MMTCFPIRQSAPTTEHDPTTAVGCIVADGEMRGARWGRVVCELRIGVVCSIHPVHRFATGMSVKVCILCSNTCFQNGPHALSPSL